MFYFSDIFFGLNSIFFIFSTSIEEEFSGWVKEPLYITPIFPYSDVEVLDKLEDVFAQVKALPSIYDNDDVTENWLESYMKSEVYNASRPDMFIKNLKKGLKIFQRTPIPLHIKFDEMREKIIG